MWQLIMSLYELQPEAAPIPMQITYMTNRKIPIPMPTKLRVLAVSEAALAPW